MSREFYHEWHDEMYKGLMQSVIISDRLHKDRRKAKIEDDIEERMQVGSREWGWQQGAVAGGSGWGPGSRE